MAVPLVPIISGAASLLGGLFGGGGKSENPVPKEVLDMLMAWSKQDFSNMFVPDEAAFTNLSKANVANIMAKLPVNMDAFSGQLAARGMFGSGEGLTRLYSDVFAPIQREANFANAQSQVQYQGLAQSGKMAGANLHADALRMLMGGYSARTPKNQNVWDTIGGMGQDTFSSWLSNFMDEDQMLRLLPKLKETLNPKPTQPEWS